jgi:hypothetical protein
MAIPPSTFAQRERMTKFRLIPYAVLTAGMLVGGGAYAQSMSGIDRQQDYQQNRIEQGIRSGQITRSEAARLEQGERAIDRAQARARADGVVTDAERRRIEGMVQRENREIYRQSHDRQQAWDRGQDWGRTDGRRDGWNDRDGRNAWNHRDGDRNHNYGNWNQGRDHNGWGQRDADRRDWGRNHNDGTGNHGRDHNGWNRDTASNGAPHQWNGRSGNDRSYTPHTPSTTPTAGTPPTSTRNYGGNRPTQPVTTAPTSTRNYGGNRPTQPATTAPTSTRNYGGNRQQAVTTAPAAPRQQAAAPTRTASSGGRSWGGR